MTARVGEVGGDGRVGESRAPETRGQRVFFIRDTAPGYWIILCEYPAERFEFSGVPMSGDNYFMTDEDAQIALDEWAIEWLAYGDEETAVEREVFDFRSQLGRLPLLLRLRHALGRAFRR